MRNQIVGAQAFFCRKVLWANGRKVNGLITEKAQNFLQRIASGRIAAATITRTKASAALSMLHVQTIAAAQLEALKQPAEPTTFEAEASALEELAAASTGPLSPTRLEPQSEEEQILRLAEALLKVFTGSKESFEQRLVQSDLLSHLISHATEAGTTYRELETIITASCRKALKTNDLDETTKILEQLNEHFIVFEAMEAPKEGLGQALATMVPKDPTFVETILSLISAAIRSDQPYDFAVKLHAKMLTRIEQEATGYPIKDKQSLYVRLGETIEAKDDFETTQTTFEVILDNYFQKKVTIQV